MKIWVGYCTYDSVILMEAVLWMCCIWANPRAGFSENWFKTTLLLGSTIIPLSKLPDSVMLKTETVMYEDLHHFYDVPGGLCFSSVGILVCFICNKSLRSSLAQQYNKKIQNILCLQSIPGL